MNEEALQHHQPPQTMVETLADPEFWYESFQNWQSEFLSIAVLIVLGIYLANAARRSQARGRPACDDRTLGLCPLRPVRAIPAGSAESLCRPSSSRSERVGFA